MRNSKVRILIGLVMLLLLVAGCQSGESAGAGEPVKGLKPPGQGLEKGRVIRVIDGDTVVVEIGGKEEKVRFIGVNTPETNHPKIGVEYYGKEASIIRRIVWKEKRSGWSWTRKTGISTVASWHIWSKDELFNATLVKEGYAPGMTAPRPM